MSRLTWTKSKRYRDCHMGTVNKVELFTIEKTSAAPTPWFVYTELPIKMDQGFGWKTIKEAKTFAELRWVEFVGAVGLQFKEK